MKRWLSFLFVLALAVALAGVLRRIPEALAEVEGFRVTEIRLQGERFFTQEDAVRTLALESTASVWDDTKVLKSRLLEHPLVRDVRVYRRFPHALLLRVVEEEPVALFPNPTLEPVDETGRILPIDPAAHKLDLPIMMGVSGSEAGSLSAEGLRMLAGEIARLAHGEPEFHARVSDYALNPRGDVTARITDPRVGAAQPGAIHEVCRPLAIAICCEAGAVRAYVIPLPIQLAHRAIGRAVPGLDLCVSVERAAGLASALVRADVAEAAWT